MKPRQKRYLILGLGILGDTVARTLAEEGAEVIAVDSSMDLVEKIKDHVSVAVQCDITDRNALEQLGVKNLDAAIICIGERFEPSVLATAHLLELGVKRVAVRANNELTASILRRIGAHDVFFVEVEMGRELAHKFYRPSISHEMELGDGFRILQWTAPENLVGQKLLDLALPRNFRVHVIAIRNPNASQSIHLPTADTVIQQRDLLLIAGHEKDTNQLFEHYKK